MGFVVGGPWEPRVLHGVEDATFDIYEDAHTQTDPGTDLKAFHSSGRSKAFRLNDVKWDACCTGAGEGKLWKQTTENIDQPPYTLLRFDPNTFIPAHHHPTGAVYVFLSGSFRYSGEATASRGEARWTAPSHYYAGERSDAQEETLIVVLGMDVNPQFRGYVGLLPAGPPPENYLFNHRRNMHR